MSLPTFAPPYPPSLSDDTPEVKILGAEFGDGYTQTTADGMNNIRSVARLQWSTLLPAEAEAIETFLRARKGYEPFLYRLSDSPSPKRWTCKEWSRSRGTPNTFTATFREDFSLGA